MTFHRSQFAAAHWPHRPARALPLAIAAIGCGLLGIAAPGGAQTPPANGNGEVAITADLNRQQAEQAEAAAQSVAEFEARRAAHAQEMQEHEAIVAEAEARQAAYEEALAIWEQNKAACEAGVISRCAP